MDPLKNELDGEDKNKLQEAENARTQKRIDDLLEKIKSESAEKDKALAKAAESEKRAKEVEFEKNFLEVSQKFPNAKEFRGEIEERVSKYNLPLDEATVLVLSKNGKMVSSEAPKPETKKGNQPSSGDGFGGSMDTTQIAPGGSKKAAEMSVDELIAGLKEAEKKGEFRLA